VGGTQLLAIGCSSIADRLGSAQLYAASTLLYVLLVTSPLQTKMHSSIAALVLYSIVAAAASTVVLLLQLLPPPSLPPAAAAAACFCFSWHLQDQILCVVSDWTFAAAAAAAYLHDVEALRVCAGVRDHELPLLACGAKLLQAIATL
jgi:hypothetical protein